MTLPQVAPELAARLANYTLDDRSRDLLRELAPMLDKHIETALDQVIAGAARLPRVAPCMPSMAQRSNVSRPRSSA